MPFVPTPNGIKAELRFTQDNQRVENVFWFLNATANPTPTDLQTVGDVLYNWWLDKISPIQSTTVLLREIYVIDASDIAGEVFTFSPAPGTSGTNVQPAMPNSTTLAVSLRTAKRGRSYRGRSYIIGLTENQVEGNTVSTAAQAAWVDAYDALVSGAAAAGYQLCIASFRNAGAARAAGVLTPVVDAIITDGVIDSQRRRLPGRGQ